MGKKSRSKVMVFIDMLGSRATSDTSISSMQRRLNFFTQTVAESVKEATSQYSVDLVSVDIESDAAALRFAEPVDAILTGMVLLQKAVSKTYNGETDAELAFRGVITRLQDSRPLRSTVPLEGFPEVNRVRLSSSFLQAIMLEKSGLKGSRLTVPPNLLSKSNRGILRNNLNRAIKLNVDPIARLDAELYPTSLNGWLDVLWPLNQPTEVGKTRQVIERRLQKHGSESGAAENLRATLEVLSAAKSKLD